MLIGVQVPPSEMEAWGEFLAEMTVMGYVYHEEGNNEVYGQFLK